MFIKKVNTKNYYLYNNYKLLLLLWTWCYGTHPFNLWVIIMGNY